MTNNEILMISAYWRSSYSLMRTENPNLVYNNDVFHKIVDSIQILREIKFTREDIEELRKIIDSEFQVFMPNPTFLLDDYEHDNQWFTQRKNELKHYYWTSYKEYLFDNGWENTIVEQLDKVVLDGLMNQLGDPISKEPFSRRGLVMGDVQSGKTSNYLGLICKAADAGYRVIILLTGTTESLRKQTQIRVEEGFIGRDSENNNMKVGVGKKAFPQGKQIPISPTSRASDFTGITHGTMFSNLYLTDTPYIFVTKKNVNTLKKIREILRNVDNNTKNEVIDLSLLIIDDEADNASVNTNDPQYDPTSINKEIRMLLNLFTKSNYVGFTATPFANIFIDPDSNDDMLKEDLFPRDFIVSLEPPSTYVGPSKLFSNANNNIKIIDDMNELFPLEHKKEWNSKEMFPSFYKAINTFLIANALRDLQDGDKKNTHRSMMINVSRFINVQNVISEIVKTYLQKVINSVKHSCFLPIEQQLLNEDLKNLNKVYQEEFSNMYTWEEVSNILYDSIKGIEVYKVPTSSKKKLDYEKYKETGLRAIVVGGLALSRGLTLEGLMVSYLYRNTKRFDVLMQMGRWFGYRNKPSDYNALCKIWILNSTKEYFTEITRSINQLKNDFRKLKESNKMPKDFGIRVRNESEELGITSPSKMRQTSKYINYSSLFGSFKETPILSVDETDIVNNHKIINEFVDNNHFESNGKILFKSNVDKRLIVKLLSDVHIHEANDFSYLNKSAVIDFINKYIDLPFDVVVINGFGRMVSIGSHELKAVSRTFDFFGDYVRLNKWRLGSPSDAAHGLSREKLNEISKNGVAKSTKDFLIEGRKPILMIYPLQLKVEDEFGLNEELNLVNTLTEKNLTPIGLAIAFGQNPSFSGSNATRFFVSLKTAWRGLMMETENEEDE